MSLAPFPTASVPMGDLVVTVYAAPSHTGQPRHRFIAVDVRLPADGVPFAHEWLGGSDRDTVTRRAAPGQRVLDTAAYEWVATPARKVMSV